LRSLREKKFTQRPLRRRKARKGLSNFTQEH